MAVTAVFGFATLLACVECWVFDGDVIVGVGVGVDVGVGVGVGVGRLPEGSWPWP